MNSPTLTAAQAHQQVEAFAQQAPTEMRKIPDGAMPPGKFIRQGDVYIEAITEIPFAYDTLTENRQLAPGETRGSRHILEGNVKIFVNKNNRDVLAGPCFSCTERVLLTHPEHAHFELPAGNYRVLFQMDARQAERTRSFD